MLKDSKSRFSDKVDNYVKYRPHYPLEIISFLEKKIGLNHNSVIADIGSGTGISSINFLKNGNLVFGIEPNDEMRFAADKNLKKYPNFKSVNSTAEQTKLQDNSIDIIIAGQAFHWFDKEKSKKEFKRILRKNGYVVLLWNDRRTDSTPFLIEYEKMLQDFGTDYKEVNHKNVDEKIFDAFFGFKKWETISFPNYQEFDLEGMNGRLLSSSYIPEKGTLKFMELMKCAEKVFINHNKGGKIIFEYDTRLFYGRL